MRTPQRGVPLAAIDVRFVPGARGTRIWITAVSLDPASPLGIRTIADPVGLTL